MYFIGIDASYTSTGLIVLDEDCKIIKQTTFKFNKKELDTEDRLHLVKEELVNYVLNMHKNHQIKVCIEGPSFHSKGRYVLQMGALNFFIRYFFRIGGVCYKVLTPSELKKYVTGKGNSSKDLILLKVYKKWGVEFQDHNLADSYGLARNILEEYQNAE